MLSLDDAREFLRIDDTDNDNIISALLAEIPGYIKVATGLTEPEQDSEPLVNTASRFILQLWYNAKQSESEKLQKTIDNLLKALTLQTNRS